MEWVEDKALSRFSGPVVDQPNCPRTPPGVGPPLRAVGRPGRRHPKTRQRHAQTAIATATTKRFLGAARKAGGETNERGWKEHLCKRTFEHCVSKSDRSDTVLYPRKSQEVIPHPQMEEEERASLEGPFNWFERVIEI